MPKYYVHLKVEIDRLVLIEADNEDDAGELAVGGAGEVEDESEGRASVEFVEDGEE